MSTIIYIEKHSLEKIEISAAKKFGFSFLESGKGAIMSKSDFIDQRVKKPSFARLRMVREILHRKNMTFGGITSAQNFVIVKATI